MNQAPLLLLAFVVSLTCTFCSLFGKATLQACRQAQRLCIAAERPGAQACDATEAE